MSASSPLPLLGGATEALLHERASATPRALVPATSFAPPPSAPSSDLPAPSLRELQCWFHDLITHSGDLGEGLRAAAPRSDPAHLLTAGPRLPALQRLGIYHAAYRARLIECLADDYPALLDALGEGPFEQLCLDYLAAHPSTSPSLNFFGRHLPGFCRRRALLDPATPWNFHADLASLEWALVEVLHAPEAPTLSPAQLALIPPERWSDARLPPSQAARLLRFDHPVNAYFQAFRLAHAPSLPGPMPSATVVYRQGYTLWRMDLSPAMATLLENLFAGQTLGQALAALPEPSAGEAEELAQSVMRWFSEWVSGGLFAALVLDEG